MSATEARTVEESYQGACEASSLKLEEHRLSAADMVAAAGMNRHRTGLALLRLASEWGSSAKPPAPTAKHVEALARTYTVEEPRTLHAGKVKIERNGEVRYVLPLRLAHEERQLWYLHELTLLLMNLKTLPTVRAAILSRSTEDGWGCDEHVIASVLLWWLDPRCGKCGGRNEIVKLRGKDVGKICNHCKGTGLERQGDPPHGVKGRKIASHIRSCIADARKELKEGAYRLRRTEAGKKHRGEM